MTNGPALVMCSVVPGVGPLYLCFYVVGVGVCGVIDAYSRRIIGWRSATAMTIKLVLDAVVQAIWTRRREGRNDFSRLVHHNSKGSQYTALAFTEWLGEAGIAPSIGTAGDCLLTG